MSGCAKTAGLTSLAFCFGIIAGMFLPLAAVVVIEMVFLLIFGYLCLFKW